MYDLQNGVCANRFQETLLTDDFMFLEEGKAVSSEAAPRTEDHSAQESAGSSGGGSAGSGAASAGGGAGQAVSSGGAGPWGESKLSDVVKGVAKAKTGGTNNNNNNTHQGQHANKLVVVANGPAGNNGAAKPTTLVVDHQASPVPNGDLAQSTLALTPPTSPGKKDKPFPATTTATTTGSAKTAHKVVAATTTDAKSGGTLMTSQQQQQQPAACVSYAKMAEQNKDRLEQMAREVKERELEQERERRRVAQTSNFFSFLGLLHTN